MTSERTERVRALFDAWHARDLDAVVAQLAPDFQYRVTSVHAASPAALCEMARRIWAATPDEHVELVTVVDDGERVAVEARTTATHLGTLELGGATLPATGRSLDVMSAYFFTFRDGLIASWNEYGSLKEWVEQMGATVTITPAGG